MLKANYERRNVKGRPGVKGGPGKQRTYIPREATAGLPDIADLAPYCSPAAWAQGLTAVTLQRVIALRGAGENFTTICIGGLNLPIRLVEKTYNKLPAHLR